MNFIKKLSSFLMAVLMASTVLTSCGQNPGQPFQTQNAASYTQNGEQEQQTDGAQNQQNQNDPGQDPTQPKNTSSDTLSAEDKGQSEYLKWTYAEWKNASDEQKLECARIYYSKLNEKNGEQETEGEFDTVADFIVTSLGLLYMTDKQATLSELIEKY
ncbi:MAG: hypothetical protein IKS19_06290 [Clostridia bacterium]|nr:hypothetical protein [Clostridia bacterium]